MPAPPSSILDPPSAAPLPRRVLIRGVNWLGDAVMTTPALQRLREALPDAHITLLTHEKLADLWQHHPALNDVVAFSFAEDIWSIASRLRREGFDTALVLPNSPRSALEVWLAGIPRRIGYTRPWRNWFLTQTIPTRPGYVRMHKRSVSEVNRLIAPRPAPADHASRTTPPATSHQIHEYLHLAAALGVDASPLPPALHVTPEEVQAAAARFGLQANPEPEHPVFALNPGAEYGPAKRWPLDRFIAAARELQQRANCTWLLLGGSADLPAAIAIRSALSTSHSPLHNLAGQTSLRDLMALLKLCRVLLTNDTGPMHLAAALGTPVVVPFGSTSPALTGPRLPGETRHRLLTSGAPCSPCFRRTCPIDFRCMTAITVDRVVEAVLQVVSY